MSPCRKYCCFCCCPAKEELQAEKNTELAVTDKTAALETPLLETQQLDTDVQRPGEARPEDKQRLKKIVKDFLKDAFEGIKVAYVDENRQAVLPGVFRLDKRVKTCTITALGTDDTFLSSNLTEWEEIKKLEDCNEEDRPSVEVEFGVTFIPAVRGARRPLILALNDAEEQQKFFISLSVVKHIGDRERPAAPTA
eukprot:Gregarina_sp_Poly_1__6551@NODE_350_length_9319_cov_183_335387_g293_i0_p5_GENE_NODE_350_length_9319_cov_183_335387_g293_i0NODE_350_length_9319_cov_183_335387_g293_i0_p5_ORF_typecomplete_len195_score31_83_NODE_350_length_9319_cov_183_335387_g293_i087279311